MIVYDSARKPLTLGPELNRGGEGAIYPVQSQGGLVAKLYTRPPQDYADKLAWMKDHPPDDPGRASGHASIAWPLDLIYNPPGQFAGFVMPHITNTAPLLAVFNPRTRAHTMPGFDWRYQHRTARNLASALKALHERNYVVGDLNESNVLVTPSALVTLIDTDSFQVHAHGRMFFCPVGKPEYTPPELQGKSFHDQPRKPEHDSFGLGVLVFQLLMEGSHPFRAQWLGEGDPPSIEERIAQGWYPYTSGTGGPVAPPAILPPLNILHPRVVELLQRCFVDGHASPRARPAPKEWERALAEAEKALIQCPNRHFYSAHLRACPHCDAPNPRRPVAIPTVSTAAKTPPAARRARVTVATIPRSAAASNAGQSSSVLHSLQMPTIALPQVNWPHFHVAPGLPAAIRKRLQHARARLGRLSIPLWAAWLLITLAAWLTSALVVDPLHNLFNDPTRGLAVDLAYGGLLGAAQWLALRRRLHEAAWWGAITAVACVIGATIDRAFHIPAPGSSAALIIGAGQAALLWSRTHGILAAGWLAVNAVAWLLAVALGGAVCDSRFAVMGIPAAGLADGALNGIALTLLLRWPARLSSIPLRMRLRIMGVSWRALAGLAGLILLIVAFAGVALQPAGPLDLLLKLSHCARILGGSPAP
ncbi:MAG: hypothetical protein M1434_07090 [Chloroflexi bacterium]|nr:hypothetical protein [Chloroflexota bacterium]MCL5274496.1 hypothetical protein [Chloroflexota bacterium]